MTETLQLLAPAKVNLALHVTGRRADGYHLLDSLVAFADTGDRLEVALAGQPALTVGGPEAADVPLDDSNSILKAAALAGVPVRVHLHKTLPTAAGIGGGSSDAAAVLRAIHQLTGQPLPDRSERLGADVPVCLMGRAARMQGIGEQLAPLSLPPLPAVLVNPRRAVSTPAVFRSLTRTDNPPLPELPDLTGPGQDIGAVIGALAQMRNDLEPAARALEPQIDRVLTALASLDGTRLARMSGSGATCFGLYDSRAAAEQAAGRLAAQHPGWWVCATVLS